MKDCSCDRYEKDSYISLDLKALAVDFELTEECFGPSHAEGTAICKHCSKEFNWVYENYIHEKLMLSKKKK